MNDEYQLEVVDNQVIYKKKKKRNLLKKVVGLSMAFVIGCVTIGSSVGFGIGLYDDRFSTNKNNSTNMMALGTTKGLNSSSGLLLASTDAATQYGTTREIVDAVQDSVVSINVKSDNYSSIFNMDQPQESAGSGIIISQDDNKIYIATNNHVIAGATSVYISVDDNNQVKANYVGSDAAVDLAVISVAKDAMLKAGISYKIATLGTKDDIAVGEKAIAIGNALGLGKTATQGIISAVNKTIQIEGTTLQVLQTDAAINPGNSGGALVNSKGEVVGINTAKLSSNTAEGVGYSIPIDVAKPILENFIKNGTTIKPYVGIEGFELTDDIISRYNLSSHGIYVNGVDAGSGAEAGGLRAGDIIVAYNGTDLITMKDLSKMIDNSKVGDTITLKVIRGNQTGEIKIVVGNLNGENF